MKTNWELVMTHLVVIALWISVGASIYTANIEKAFLFTVMIIAWKMSIFKK